MSTQTRVDIATDLADIRDWWACGAPVDGYRADAQFAIAGTEHDQPVPDGVENPYWELLRHVPSLDDGWDGVTPYGFPIGLGHLSRRDLAKRFSWAIPSPGDMTWLASLLDGQGLVEVGAGAGYWAWQAEQCGIDVVAYDPTDPADNGFTSGMEFTTVLRDDWRATAQHPDRALLLCWPSYGEPWARLALDAYKGDLLVYVGEGEGGCCADDDFFHALAEQWNEIGESPYHRTWWGIHCRMVAYRRR